MLLSTCRREANFFLFLLFLFLLVVFLLAGIIRSIASVVASNWLVNAGSVECSTGLSLHFCVCFWRCCLPDWPTSPARHRPWKHTLAACIFVPSSCGMKDSCSYPIFVKLWRYNGNIVSDIGFDGSNREAVPSSCQRTKFNRSHTCHSDVDPPLAPRRGTRGSD